MAKVFHLLRSPAHRDDVNTAPHKLNLEDFTPLQMGDQVVPQAPVRVREELWRLIRRGCSPAPQFSWLLSLVSLAPTLAGV